MKKRKKRLISLVCVLTVLFCGISVKAQDEPLPDNLYARSAVLMDADSGRILYGKEADEKRPMASTTKIMTCILTLEHMDEGQKASVSEAAEEQPKVHLGVREGEEYYVRDLLYSLMLESHNDSAVIIAEEIGGSVKDFAVMMNEKAVELGCTDTHFVTPNGLDGEDEGGLHSTTASDLAGIMKYCIMDSPKREEFLEITGTKSYQFADVSGKRNFSCSNHNAFLDMMDGALSGKTGFTADAGYCYVGALKRDGKTFVVALLACGWPDNKGYKWKDTRTLMEYGLSNYEYRDVWEEIQEEEIVIEGGINPDDIYEGNTRVSIGVEEPEHKLRVLLRADENVEIKKEIERKLKAPVKKEEKVGKITFLLDGKVIGSYDMITLGEVRKRSFQWCLGEMIKLLLFV